MKRPNQCIAPFTFHNLLPGERRPAHCRISAPHVNFSRLMVKVLAETPEIKYYTKAHKVKGSSRRGQMASNHWAIDRLKHLDGGWEPQVVLCDIRIGRTSQLAYDGKIPVQMFSEAQPIYISMALDVCRPGIDVTIELLNLDMRVTHVRAVMIGMIGL